MRSQFARREQLRYCSLGFGVFFVLLLVLPQLANAYVRTLVPGTNACLYWGDREVTYHLNELGSMEHNDGSDHHASFDSFEAWNAPDCSDFSFVFGGFTARTDTGFVEGSNNNINLVVFRDSLCRDVVPHDDECWYCLDHGGPCCSTEYNCWTHAAGAIAITTTTFYTSTGLLVNADIEMNEAQYLFTTGDGILCEDRSLLPDCTNDTDCMDHEACLRGKCRTRGCVHTDIANTLTHEVGHALGLDHTPTLEATMYATAMVGETHKRRLHEVDIEGLCDIYPYGGSTLTCLGEVIKIIPLENVDADSGCSGCTSGAGSLGSSLVLLILLFFAYLSIAVRRSKSCSLSLPCLFVLPVAAFLGTSSQSAIAGELELDLMQAEAVVVLQAKDIPLQCTSEGRPAVQRANLKRVLFSSSTIDFEELLLVQGVADLPLNATSVFALIRHSRSYDAAGCVTAPPYAVEKALLDWPVDEKTIASFSRYIDSLRVLPSGGGGFARAKADLWVKSLIGEAGALQKHAAVSLDAWLFSNSISESLFIDLVGALGDESIPDNTKLLIVGILERLASSDNRSPEILEESSPIRHQSLDVLLGMLDHPNPTLRKRLVRAVLPAALEGDIRVLAKLESLRDKNDRPELHALLDEVLGPVRHKNDDSSQADTLRSSAYHGHRLVLVLLGMVALGGMAFLPIIFRVKGR